MCDKCVWSFVLTLALTVSVAIVSADDNSSPKAHTPEPPNGATDIKQSSDLRWIGHERSTHYDVYFGTNAQAVESATVLSPQYQGRSAYSSKPYRRRAGFTLPDLAWNTAYYWRIDEVNDLDPDSPYKGDLWSFTTADFLIIDDIEDYSNVMPNRIFDVWIDGWRDPSNGSLVGYDDIIMIMGASFQERDIVHGGEQSMPYFYDTRPQHCVATKTLTGLYRNWTQHNFASLSVWLRGRPTRDSFVERPSGIFTMTHITQPLPEWFCWSCNDQLNYAFKRLDGLGALTARIDSISGHDLSCSAAGLMIRETLDPDSHNAFVYVEPDSNHLRLTYRPGPLGTCHTDTAARNQTGLTLPYWLKLQRTSLDSVTAYHADDINGSPGQWTELGSVDLSIAPIAYIGLALSCGSEAAPAKAVFSNVSTTGNVIDTDFTNQNIGANNPEKIYVELTDVNAGSAKAYHPDPNVCTTDEWTEWNIPLTEFAEIDLGELNTISLGFGPKEPDHAGGSGLMYFDDICVHPPRCMPHLARPAADFNSNCIVDFPDFALLAEEWLQIAPNIHTDLNNDYQVDFGDVKELSNTWLEQILWP